MTTVYLLPYNVLYCFIRSNRDRIGFYAEIQIICMLQAAELGLADRLYCLAYGPPPVYRYTSLITNIETIFKIIKWTRKARCVIFRGFKRVFRHEGGNFSCHNRQGFSTALIFWEKSLVRYKLKGVFREDNRFFLHETEFLITEKKNNLNIFSFFITCFGNFYRFRKIP